MRIKRMVVLVPALSALLGGEMAWSSPAEDAGVAPVAEPRHPTGAQAANVEVTAGQGGFAIESADKAFRLRFRLLLQADGRFILGGDDPGDGFLIRRARTELTGTLYGRLDFRIMPDLAGSGTTLMDAWLLWNLSPVLKIQVGKIKMPIGLERAQARENNLFNEMGYPTALAPNRDIGIDVQGECAHRTLAWFVGVFDGAGDGASLTSDTDDNREIAARVLATPFRESDSAWKRLGFGIAGTWGRREGTPASYRSVGQQTFFSWRSQTRDDGTAWRVVPQVYLYRGPFGFLSEYALSSHELSLVSEHREVAVSAWTAQASWVLTGEEAGFDGVVPRRPVGQDAGRGAWEIALRATHLAVDDTAFPVFADPDESARGARTAGIGLNWYLNRTVRCSADYHHTRFDDGRLDDEDVIIVRAQLRF